MGLKLVIFDLDQTVTNPEGTLQEGMDRLLGYLKKRSIACALISLKPRNEAQRIMESQGLSSHILLGREDLGDDKLDRGNPDLVTSLCDQVTCTFDEALYVGHSLFHARSAIDAGVFYVNAIWSKTETGYGYKVASPSDIETLIDGYFRKDDGWYGSLDREDRAGRPVRVLVLFDGGGGGKPFWKDRFLELFKLRKDPSPFMKDFLLTHLLTSLYLTGIHRRIDAWTIYPANTVLTDNRFIDPSFGTSLSHFRDRYRPHLFMRHTEAEECSLRRRHVSSVPFSNQVASMIVNPDYREQVKGQRILVLDDFLVEGNSVEWARSALLQAGADEVVTAAVAAFGTEYRAQTLGAGSAWNVYEPSRLTDADFTPQYYKLSLNRMALNEVANSYRRLTGEV